MKDFNKFFGLLTLWLCTASATFAGDKFSEYFRVPLSDDAFVGKRFHYRLHTVSRGSAWIRGEEARFMDVDATLEILPAKKGKSVCPIRVIYRSPGFQEPGLDDDLVAWACCDGVESRNFFRRLHSEFCEGGVLEHQGQTDAGVRAMSFLDSDAFWMQSVFPGFSFAGPIMQDGGMVGTDYTRWVYENTECSVSDPFEVDGMQVRTCQVVLRGNGSGVSQMLLNYRLNDPLSPLSVGEDVLSFKEDDAASNGQVQEFKQRKPTIRVSTIDQFGDYRYASSGWADDPAGWKGEFELVSVETLPLAEIKQLRSEWMVSFPPGTDIINSRTGILEKIPYAEAQVASILDWKRMHCGALPIAKPPINWSYWLAGVGILLAAIAFGLNRRNLQTK